MAGPQPGDFGVTAGSGWAMWFVRLGTFSRYGHAAVAVETDALGGVTVIEAAGGGARRRRVAPGSFVWSAAALTAQQRHAIVEAATGCLGLPYDWADIIRFIPRFWGARLRKRSPDHADDRLICSELVVWVYRQAGVDLAPNVAAGDVSPGDLADWITRH